MKIFILSAERGWHTRELLRAIEGRGHEGRLLPIQALTASLGEEPPRLRSDGITVDDCDAAIVRIIPRGSLEQTIFRVDALHWLERRGVAVFNSASTIEKTVDKFLTSALLQAAGLPTPRTLVTERLDDAMAAFREMKDAIVKPLFGSNGRGMVRVTDEEVAYRVFKALEMERAVYYVQATIVHDGRDLRVFTLGGDVLASMWRRAEGWRTNVARGGIAERATLTPRQRELALRAADVVGAEYAGVDIVPSSEGKDYVIEVNGIPGWRGLQGATRTDVALALVRHVETQVVPAR